MVRNLLNSEQFKTLRQIIKHLAKKINYTEFFMVEMRKVSFKENSLEKRYIDVSFIPLMCNDNKVKKLKKEKFRFPYEIIENKQRRDRLEILIEKRTIKDQKILKNKLKRDVSLYKKQIKLLSKSKDKQILKKTTELRENLQRTIEEIKEIKENIIDIKKSLTKNEEIWKRLGFFVPIDKYITIG